MESYIIRCLQALARKAEKEAKLQEALAAEAAGRTEEVYVPPVIVQKTTRKVEGVR